MQFDYTNRQVACNARGARPLYVAFDEIEDAYLDVKETNESGRSTSSLIGRAAIFGALTGGFGAVVGALSAKTTHRRAIQRVELVIEVLLGGERLKLRHSLSSSGSLKGYVGEEAIRVGERIIKKLMKPSPEIAEQVAAPLVCEPDVREVKSPAMAPAPVKAVALEAALEGDSFTLGELLSVAAHLIRDGRLTGEELGLLTKRMASIKPNDQGKLSIASDAVSVILALRCEQLAEEAGEDALGLAAAGKEYVLDCIRNEWGDCGSKTVQGQLDLLRMRARHRRAK